jgi:hypothetical protein
MAQPYEPLTDRGKATRIALGAVIVLGLANALSEMAEIRLLGRVIDGEVLSPASLEANDSRVALLGVLQFVAYIAAAVLFIRWFHRAYRNLDALGSHRRHGTGWAIGGWFVPILSLFRPKQIIDDIWWGTKRPTDTATSAPLLMVWWVGFVVSQTVANVIVRITFPEDGTAEQLQRSDYAWIVSDLLDCAAAVLAILVVRRTTDRMEAFAREPAEPPSSSFGPPMVPAI